jgi:hypothetical protein
MSKSIARLQIIRYLHHFGKAYNPLNKFVRRAKKIMFSKQWAIVLLVFGANYFFDLLKKIIGRVPLTDSEQLGFFLIIFGIIAIWFLMNKFDRDDSRTRQQELKEAWKDALKETGIQDALTNLAKPEEQSKHIGTGEHD